LKLSKQRTSLQISRDNVRIPKVTQSFKLGDKWFNKDGRAYNTLGKLQSEMNSNPMKSRNDMKEKLENMTTELSLYKERVNEVETSDKKVFVYYFYFYIWYYIQIYGRFLMLYGIF